MRGLSSASKGGAPGGTGLAAGARGGKLLWRSPLRAWEPTWREASDAVCGASDGQSVSTRSGQECGQPCAAVAAQLPRPGGRCLSGPDGGDPRQLAGRLCRAVAAVAAAGVGAGGAWGASGRHGGGDAAQRAGDGGCSLWHPDGRGGDQRDQHPARGRDHRLHSGPRAGQGAPDRPRILTRSQSRARASREKAVGRGCLGSRVRGWWRAVG